MLLSSKNSAIVCERNLLILGGSSGIHSIGKVGDPVVRGTGVKMATASGPVEVDAVFIKALKLLHSRNPDSLEQLRALRDDVIRQHNQQVPTTKTIKVRIKIILTLD